MNKSRLINEVSKKPELWGKSNNTQGKLKEDEIWEDIASNMGVSPEACKTQWKRLRMRFSVELYFCQNRKSEDEINGTGGENKNYSGKWKYFDAMKFFSEFKKKSDDSGMGCFIKNELLGQEEHNETEATRSLLSDMENTPSCSNNSKNIISEINSLSDNANTNIKEEPELNVVDVFSSNEIPGDEKYNETDAAISLINDMENTPPCSNNSKNIISKINSLSDNANSNIKEEPEINIVDIISTNLIPDDEKYNETDATRSLTNDVENTPPYSNNFKNIISEINSLSDNANSNIKEEPEINIVDIISTNLIPDDEKYNETDATRSLINDMDNTPSCSNNSKNIISEINFLSDNANLNIKEEPELNIVDILSTNEIPDDEKYNLTDATKSNNSKNIISEIHFLSDNANSSIKEEPEINIVDIFSSNEIPDDEKYNETDAKRSLINDMDNTPSCSHNSKNIISAINFLSDNANSNIKEEPEINIVDLFSSNEIPDDEKYNETDSMRSFINDIENTPSCSKNSENIFSEINLFSDDSNTHIKEEPELNIEDIYSSKRENPKNNSSKKLNKRKNVSKPTLKTYSAKRPRVTEASQNCNKVNFKRFKFSILTKDFGDPDYNFLISFSPHLKLMTQVQNIQLRSTMPDLMLSMLKTSPFSNALQNQMPCTYFTSSIDIIDAETNFLISFLPHLKTLSMVKNLEFRKKLTDLIFYILQ